MQHLHSTMTWANIPQATATTHKQRQESKEAIANVLQGYDTAAGFGKHAAALHYFTADSSSEESDSKKYAAEREAAEKGILQKIEGKVNQEYSSSQQWPSSSDANQLRTDIAKGGSTLSQTQLTRSTGSSKVGHSYSAMEKVMASDKDTLFKTFMHPDSDDSEH